VRKHATALVLVISALAFATPGQANALARLPQQIAAYKVQVNHMRLVMGLPVMQYAPEASFQGYVLLSPQFDLVHELHSWQRTLRIVRWQFSRVPNKGAWMCIHRYEGSWTDPNPPYYGGLQMDEGFQRTYGRHLYDLKGTADHWTPLEQMWTAEKARRLGRGFYPWPNTARYCGLI